MIEQYNSKKFKDLNERYGIFIIEWRPAFSKVLFQEALY